MQTANWNNHQFQVFNHATATWNDVAGIYIFAGIDSSNKWHALYIGQASSFLQRLPNHERWAEAARLGAKHVHAAVVPQEANRDTIERQLIQAFQPPLNEHHR